MHNIVIIIIVFDNYYSYTYWYFNEHNNFIIHYVLCTDLNESVGNHRKHF